MAKMLSPPPLLVVDDEELNRDMLERRLRRRGFDVIVAAGGAEALEIAHEQAVDLVLLDIMMPVIDGLEVLTRLRQEFSALALPVIMVTAKDDSNAVVECLDRGANDYVTKPIDFPVLMARVDTALRGKHAEEALRQARDDAEAANHAKSQFLASMSHELRTPLNSIIGFSNVLLKKGFAPETQERKYLDRIHQNGLHLLELINDVLDLSKVEAGQVELEWQDVDLARLIAEAVALTQGRLLESNVELRVELPPDLAPVWGDATRLKQVLINLLSNATKFTERGAITVRIEADDLGVIDSLEVSDTGIGIGAENLERVFSAFQQADSSTSRKYGGTGLGLAICRQLLEMMDFTIDVTSELGVGSTFRISFRRAPPVAAPS